MPVIVFFVRALFVLGATVSAACAQNLNFWQTCTTPNPYPTLTQIVNVGRDAQVGDFIGPGLIFFYGPMQQNCTVHRENFTGMPNGSSRATLRLNAGNTDIWGTAVYDELAYPVYKVNLGGGKQIGFIVIGMNGSTNYGTGYFSNIGGIIFPDITSGLFLKKIYTPDNPSSLLYQYILSMRLVKISDDYPVANDNISFNPLQIRIETLRVMNGSLTTMGGVTGISGNVSLDSQPSANVNPVINIQFHSVTGSCLFESRLVDLSTVSASQVPNPDDGGVSNHSVFFKVGFNSCPRHMNSFKLKFEPVPAGTVINNGVLPLIPPSTASGVGVQVVHDYVGWEVYPPVSFDLAYDISRHWPLGLGVSPKVILPHQYDQYSPADMSSYLPLAARIVRVNPVITPGTVRAAMKIVATYK